MPDHVLIIGSGIAAVSTCAALRAHGFTGRISVVGDEPWQPYDRPQLSKRFLAGDLDGPQIALQPTGWYVENRIELRTGVAVTAIDAKAGRAELAEGTWITADALVLATGGRPRRLAVPGADHSAVKVLRTRDDAEALREVLVSGARVLIVGAGLIGAEVASTATHRGCRVTLIDPTPLPMHQAFGPHAAAALHAQHVSNGVTVLCSGIDAITQSNDKHVARATLVTGQVVDADVVVAGIGIMPNTELAEAAGLDTDNGVLVDATMRSTAPNVYAVGDIARVVGPDGPLRRSEHWDNARRTAEIAAREIIGLPPEPARAPWFWTDRYGTHLEMAGHYDPEAEPVLRGDIEAGNGTVFYCRDGRCVGAVALERPLDIRAAQRLIDRAIVVEPTRLADETIDPRRLVAGN